MSACDPRRLVNFNANAAPFAHREPEAIPKYALLRFIDLSNVFSGCFSDVSLEI